ncbi:MAG TPA: molecular chaperone DnaJ [Actinomycetota bacterium]|jgi:molecular chaperone DnaJ|nr:molecular chaperone DnaJ [Actinomycetota bacterium]
MSHYETLGVSPEATQEEIKRAYRRLARRYHPDANPNDPEAAERFKEVGRAYEVLSDPDKRRRYDLYGDDRAAAGFGGFGDFGDFGGVSDIFSAFFGGVSGGTARRATRGADVLAEVELTLEEAASGAQRDVEISVLGECPACSGSGAAPGTHPTACDHCHGTGEVRQVRRTLLGNVMTATSCSRCSGTGRVILDPCRKCSGSGRVRTAETLTVQIPAGIEDGAHLRVTGRGEAGLRGGRAGDLYVQVHVAEHPIFKRAGSDLACEVAVPMTVAALGGTVEIPTLEGPQEHKIDPGTQSGKVVRLKGRGMPRLDGYGRGSLVALLKVETPVDLDMEQAELLQQLAKLRGEDAGHAGFFEKLRRTFR